MNDTLMLLVVFWAAVNPPAAIASLPAAFEGIERGRRTVLLVGGWVVAATLLALAALLHDPFFDLLDVSAPSFDVAAGIVMLAGAARPLLRGRAIEEATASLLDASPRAALAPLAVPLLASPAALVAAIAYGERVGEGPTIVAAAAVTGLAALVVGVEPLLRSRHRQAVDAALARLTGALLVVVAIGLIVDGVMSV